jgi:hypothetical protein
MISSVKISKIEPTGLNLFDSEESYLGELSDSELTDVTGGNGGIREGIAAGVKASSERCANWAHASLGFVEGIGKAAATAASGIAVWTHLKE